VKVNHIQNLCFPSLYLKLQSSLNQESNNLKRLNGVETNSDERIHIKRHKSEDEIAEHLTSSSVEIREDKTEEFFDEEDIKLCVNQELQFDQKFFIVSDIVLKNEGFGYGIFLKHVNLDETVVSSIKKGSVADKDGRLKIGDQLIQINLNWIYGQNFEEINKYIQTNECLNSMALIVARPFEENDIDESKCINKELLKDRVATEKYLKGLSNTSPNLPPKTSEPVETGDMVEIGDTVENAGSDCSNFFTFLPISSGNCSDIALQTID